MCIKFEKVPLGWKKKKKNAMKLAAAAQAEEEHEVGCGWATVAWQARNSIQLLPPPLLPSSSFSRLIATWLYNRLFCTQSALPVLLLLLLLLFFYPSWRHLRKFPFLIPQFIFIQQRRNFLQVAPQLDCHRPPALEARVSKGGRGKRGQGRRHIMCCIYQIDFSSLIPAKSEYI